MKYWTSWMLCLMRGNHHQLLVILQFETLVTEILAGNPYILTR